MTKPVIKAKNITKEYNLGKTIAHVLHGINFDIFPGEYVMLFGPSGSGKSTLMNIIAGLETVTSGKIFIRGTDLSKLDSDEIAQYHRQKIGFVFQQFNLIRSLTVAENIALPQLAAGIPKSRRMKRAMQLLEEVGLVKFANYLPTELSGGQQQRVAIARALVNNPWIILADEPTGNLDSAAADDIMELLKDLNERGKRTIILISHNPDYIYYPHRVFYVKDGLITKSVINREKYAYEEVIMGNKTFNMEELLKKNPTMPLREKQGYEWTNEFYAPYKLDALSKGRLERMAHTITSYLENNISEKELLEILDKPFKKGGIGLRKQLAKDLAMIIIDKNKEVINKFHNTNQISEKSENKPIIIKPDDKFINQDQINSQEHVNSKDPEQNNP